MIAPWPWQNLSLSTVGSCKIKSKSNTSLLQEGKTGAQSDHSKTRFQLCKPHDARCLGSTHDPPGSSSGLRSLTPSVLPTSLACRLSSGMLHPTAAAVLGGCPTEVTVGWRSFFAMEANRFLLYDLTHLSIFSVRTQASGMGSVSQQHPRPGLHMLLRICHMALTIFLWRWNYCPSKLVNNVLYRNHVSYLCGLLQLASHPSSSKPTLLSSCEQKQPSTLRVVYTTNSRAVRWLCG